MAGEIPVLLYRGLTGALAPIIPVVLRHRLRRGKEDPRRISERRGLASATRPAGILIWIHAASVGESVAVLPLIAALLKDPAHHVLVTTGTVTSAGLMQQRLPGRAIHQYVPIDLRGDVVRFLDHWRPDVALFVESELWPNLLLETRRRKIPLGLINARISAQSFAGWKRMPGLSQRIFSAFDVCLAQDEAVARRLSALGAQNVRVTGNLKADAPPLPADEEALSALQQAIGDRPVFLFASTHPGEADAVIATATALTPTGAITIVAPRHTEHGAAIESAATARGLICLRRSGGALPARETQLYIADTMGELGLLYRVARASFVGGSLIPHGGQNPLEGARFSLPILAGPHTDNFDAFYRALFDAQGMGRIGSAGELAQTAVELMKNIARTKRVGELARSATDRMGGALELTHGAVEQLLAHARA